MNEMNCSVQLNTTFTHTIQNANFDNLSQEMVNTIFKDGRVFSHFIEKWIENTYNLTHIPGCKGYDFQDKQFPDTLYDEKTYIANGCNFRPSNQKGQGRTFNKEVFEEKTKKLIFCIVSNVEFPKIQIKFIRGCDLIQLYPKGIISTKERIKFFN